MCDIVAPFPPAPYRPKSVEPKNSPFLNPTHFSSLVWIQFPKRSRSIITDGTVNAQIGAKHDVDAWSELCIEIEKKN